MSSVAGVADVADGCRAWVCIGQTSILLTQRSNDTREMAVDGRWWPRSSTLGRRPRDQLGGTTADPVCSSDGWLCVGEVGDEDPGLPDFAQRTIAAVAAVITAPIVAALALLVRAETAGPPLYRATRIGRKGRPFTCFKIRTMPTRVAEESGPAVTRPNDARITRLGRVLRRFRLDELPQLWNVAAGQMRLVGPRPEAPEFVDLDDPLHHLVFTATPGITGLTQLAYVDEASLLGGPDPELRYRAEILPAKLRIDAAYLRQRSFGLDLWILARTVAAVLGRPTTVAEIEARVGTLDPEVTP